MGVLMRNPNESRRLQREKGKRNNLKGREACREAHVQYALASKIPVVPRTDNPADKKKNGVQINEARCRTHPYDAHG
jgi:hypothetical protein